MISPPHNTHLSRRIADAMDDSNTETYRNTSMTLINESVEVPIRADVLYTPQPMPTNQHAHGLQHTSGFFTNAHDFNLYNPIMVDGTRDYFMEKFAEHTIQGAEMDSSARDPPPRCHPGTRVEIVDRMRSRLRNPLKRVQWLVGPAGVGKSAIMQTIAELEKEDSAVVAALFFSSPNGRNDPSKVITTLAYQIALQHGVYHYHTQLKVNADPKLWEKSIDAQFAEFIIRPFATMGLYNDPRPVLMFIDGLDECKGQQKQIHFLSLILDFVTKYPQAPLLWVISSRPEAHITEYLNLLMFYDKEEVSIDSTEACQDAERFLRAKFEKIRVSNSLIKSLYRQWPIESQLMKLFAAVLGLFAYADTVIRFVGDLSAGDPITRLQVILDLIDKSPTFLSVSSMKPMAHLDALYRHILSQVSPDNIPHVEEILAYVIFSQGERLVSGAWELIFMCNWMHMSPNVMYGALLQLHSVIYVPLPGDARHERLRIYHKSFSDFVLDPQRSGLSIGTLGDEKHRNLLRSARILRDIPYPAMDDSSTKVILSWPHDEDEDDSQRDLYSEASYSFWLMSSLPDIPLLDIGHALEVLQLNIYEVLLTEGWPHWILFDDTYPDLSRLLREDGALQDIPVTLLDLNVVNECGGSIYKEGDDIGWRTQRHEGYSNLLRELIAHLEQAQAQSPHDLVRVFIGAKFIGVVGFTTSEDLPEPNVFSFVYDFSTIYQRLKEQGEGTRKRLEG